MLTVALDVIYPRTNSVPELVDTVTATIARLNDDVSSPVPSCAIPSVSGKSSPTKGRGARYPECPTPYEAFAQEGHLPVPQIRLSILPNLYLQIALSPLGKNGPYRPRTIQTFPRH